MTAIFWASSRPVPQPVAEMPDWLTHGLAYAVLAALMAWAARDGCLRSLSSGVAVAVFMLSVAYGVSDEWH
ncbi:MAG: VanZ family protein, partial [Vicinamibacteria bacterium]|nr:VanZ family protein [Vicinamibacteria bacterium]